MPRRLAVEARRAGVRLGRSDGEQHAVGTERAGRLNLEGGAPLLHQVADDLSDEIEYELLVRF